MHRSLSLVFGLLVLFVPACGEKGPPDLEAISTYGMQQGNWQVSPDDPYTCLDYGFELENNTNRQLHITRMYPIDTVVKLAEGPYAAPYFWGWMEAEEQYGSGYLILEPGERQNPLFQLCVDASPIFGRKVGVFDEGFCAATYDPNTGEYDGVTGDLRVEFEGAVAMEGFDEYGYEFGPRGPTPQWLGGSIHCVP